MAAGVEGAAWPVGLWEALGQRFPDPRVGMGYGEAHIFQASFLEPPEKGAPGSLIPLRSGSGAQNLPVTSGIHAKGRPKGCLFLSSGCAYPHHRAVQPKVGENGGIGLTLLLSNCWWTSLFRRDLLDGERGESRSIPGMSVIFLVDGPGKHISKNASSKGISMRRYLSMAMAWKVSVLQRGMESSVS